MEEQAFSLKKFGNGSSGIAVAGRAGRRDNTLAVRYELTGNLQDIDIPRRKQKPSRLKGLWENTCFELFVAARGCDPYWEINISPLGDWNVFRFDRYGEKRNIADLREETAVAALVSRTGRKPGSLSLMFELNLDGLISEDQRLEVGISAVIKSEEKSYWALIHCGAKPDFHRRDGFILAL